MRKVWRSASARRICDLAGRDSVEQAAEEIGRRLTDGIVAVPIELELMFSRLNIQSCRPDPELEIAGELRPAATGYEIVYSLAQSGRRRRFTVAHEMAHAVIERTGKHCPRKGKELERICDMIASQILVPTDMLRQHSAPCPNLDRISELATAFNVSLTMMALRCARDLGSIVFQADGKDVAWIAGIEGMRILRPRVQFRRIATMALEMAESQMRFSLELQDSAWIEVEVKWRKTGEQRLLFGIEL